MARFLICVWPLRSHFFPLVPIAQALREQGHEVALYSGPKACDVFGGEGFTCFPFAQVDADWVESTFLGGGTPTQWTDTFRFRRFMIDWLVGTIPAQVADLDAVVEEWKPDVVFSETSMWGPMLVLHEQRNLPVAVFSTVIACLLPGPEAPPYGVGLKPPRNWRTRWIARTVERLKDAAAGKLTRAVNTVRAGYGLGPIPTRTVTEFNGRMPLYVVPGVREFDYNRQDLPANVQYVGPCAWNRTQKDVAPAWLSELAGDQPVVHVTEGTVHTQKPFVLSAAARGLADLPLQVVMTTGGHRGPEDVGLGELAPNIRVERWVAHSDLLPHTDVVVTTGGAGTVSAVLEAGIPLVIVPTEWDKPENARRVEDAGAGIFLPASRCSPARLREAVQRVLTDPSFRQNARRLGDLWAQHNGPTRAAELLGELAGAAGMGYIPLSDYEDSPAPRNHHDPSD